VIGLAELMIGTRFLAGLPAFLREPAREIAARAELERRLARREADFVALVKRAVYDQPASPYRALLRHAGCEYGDLARDVGRDGVEAVLGRLAQQGVYLTVAELKGRTDVKRGGRAFRVDPATLRNPASVPHIPGASSGSRGTAALVPLDLAFVRERAVDYALFAAALLPAATVHGVWKAPGGDVLDNLLCFAGAGMVAERWFLQFDPGRSGLHPAYRASATALRLGSRLAGVRLPRPEVVPLDDALPVARWLASAIDRGCTPHLQIFSSAAVAVCRAAQEAGLRLEGARFMVGGEPLTPARVEVIRGSGAVPLPRYGTAEAPSIALGCAQADRGDTVHLLGDLYALIPARGSATESGLPDGALLLTALRPTAPLVLLNASLGDQAVVDRAGCRCPLSRAGWTTTLHTIRSFEKLTAGGVSFMAADLIRVLEERLPECFGGGPTDFQLVEQEAPGGPPCLRLLVHPRVPAPDLPAVGEAFLDSIGGGRRTERLMAALWRQGRFLHVERRAPVATASGKILHLLVDRGVTASGASEAGDEGGPDRMAETFVDR
jgi:hypothetical protein